MIWRPTNCGDTGYNLRDGYIIRPIKYEDIGGWCGISVALTGEKWSEQTFIKKMLFEPPLPLSPSHIFGVFRGPDEKMVATASACIDAARQYGNLHMVSAADDCRGLGLGKAVCAECVKAFIAAGCREADLSTDDFRKSAIAIYLKLGFRPWLYEDDMRDRWLKILDEMQWQKEVLAYGADKRDTALYAGHIG
jgi:ribosomal protein S18 acetylase RimI-like enzyme